MLAHNVCQFQASLLFATVSLPVIVLFSGVVIIQKDTNVIFHWLFELCFVKHAGDSSIASILGYNRTKLDCAETFYCHFERPKKLLDVLGLDDEIGYLNIAYLVGFLALFRFVAFFMINYRLKH